MRRKRKINTNWKIRGIGRKIQGRNGGDADDDDDDGDGDARRGESNGDGIVVMLPNDVGDCCGSIMK